MRGFSTRRWFGESLASQHEAKTAKSPNSTRPPGSRLQAHSSVPADPGPLGNRSWRQVTQSITVCLRVVQEPRPESPRSWGTQYKDNVNYHLSLGFLQSKGSSVRRTGLINRTRSIHASVKPSGHSEKPHNAFYSCLPLRWMEEVLFCQLHLANGQGPFCGEVTLPPSGLCKPKFPQACCGDRG